MKTYRYLEGCADRSSISRDDKTSATQLFQIICPGAVEKGDGCNLLREIAGSVFFFLHAESTTAGPAGSLISCYSRGGLVSAKNTKCSLRRPKKKKRKTSQIKDSVTKSLGSPLSAITLYTG